MVVVEMVTGAAAVEMVILEVVATEITAANRVSDLASCKNREALPF